MIGKFDLIPLSICKIYIPVVYMVTIFLTTILDLFYWTFYAHGKNACMSHKFSFSFGAEEYLMYYNNCCFVGIIECSLQWYNNKTRMLLKVKYTWGRCKVYWLKMWQNQQR